MSGGRILWAYLVYVSETAFVFIWNERRLHRRSLRSRNASLSPSATCCRSRFGVALLASYEFSKPLSLNPGCGAATPTRSRPRWSYPASLCVNILKKVARIYPQANACPACFVRIFSIRPFFLRLYVMSGGRILWAYLVYVSETALSFLRAKASTAYRKMEKTV